jgi:Ca2+-binding RTX toxin-like protein
LTIYDFSNGELCIGLGWDSYIWFQEDSYWWNVTDADGSKAPEDYYISFDPWWFSAEIENTVDDQIMGTDDADEINSGEGDDTVFAADGDDTVYGGPGDDIL